MIRSKSIKQRNRLLRLLLAAVVIPGIIISIVGVVAVSKQKRAKEIKLEEEYRHDLMRIRNGIESSIERAVRGTFLEISREKIEFDNPGSVQKALRETLLKNPIVKYPFIINSKSEFVFPFARKISPVFFKMPKTILYQGTTGQYIKKGENMEYRERRFIDALKNYLNALHHNRDRDVLPYIYHSIARCYYKLKKFPQAVSYLEDLRKNDLEHLKKDKSLYFSVLYQNALSYKAMGEREDTAENFLQLYDEILQYEMSGDEDSFAFFKNEALQYLNRHIEEIDREKQKSYPAEVLDRLQSLSGIDISLSWRYFDFETPMEDTKGPAVASERAGGPISTTLKDLRQKTGLSSNGSIEEEEPGISSDASKFKKIREFYIEHNEKSLFYRQVKKLPQWQRADIPYFGLKKIGDECIAYDKLNTQNRRKKNLFFGFLLSSDYIRDHIFAGVIQKQLNRADIRVTILDKRATPGRTETGWELMSAPFRKYMTGKKLVFAAGRRDFLQGIIERELLLNYSLIIALVLALIFGIFFFYKYISRESELIQIKSGFVDSASHTLKTPLTRIRMLAEKMDLGWVKDESKRQEYYRSIVSETDRMTEMIDNMLDFSKIEAGKKVYEPRQADIKEVVTPIISRFEKHLKSLGFRFEVDIAENIPEFCFDPEAVHVIMVNLLQNAIKYSLKEKYIAVRIYNERSATAAHKSRRNDSPTIIKTSSTDNTLTHSKPEKKRQRVVVEVEDRGIGLEQKEKEKIFAKFYRVDNEDVKVLEGSGLGLFLVHHAVKAHDGEIEVKSEVGTGTTFKIYFPV